MVIKNILILLNIKRFPFNYVEETSKTIMMPKIPKIETNEVIEEPIESEELQSKNFS